MSNEDKTPTETPPEKIPLIESKPKEETASMSKEEVKKTGFINFYLKFRN